MTPRPSKRTQSPEKSLRSASAIRREIGRIRRIGKLAPLDSVRRGQAAGACWALIWVLRAVKYGTSDALQAFGAPIAPPRRSGKRRRG